eukprot:COSAG04_NODE_828_length_10025_cov_3.607092_2_plen_269_part_00
MRPERWRKWCRLRVCRHLGCEVVHVHISHESAQCVCADGPNMSGLSAPDVLSFGELGTHDMNKCFAETKTFLCSYSAQPRKKSSICCPPHRPPAWLPIAHALPQHPLPGAIVHPRRSSSRAPLRKARQSLSPCAHAGFRADGFPPCANEVSDEEPNNYLPLNPQEKSAGQCRITTDPRMCTLVPSTTSKEAAACRAGPTATFQETQRPAVGCAVWGSLSLPLHQGRQTLVAKRPSAESLSIIGAGQSQAPQTRYIGCLFFFFFFRSDE